jgi:hypothetical protein
MGFSSSECSYFGASHNRYWLDCVKFVTLCVWREICSALNIKHAISIVNDKNDAVHGHVVLLTVQLGSYFHRETAQLS